ncbi:MAG: hypothetical protein M1820_005237 [Bogoriella megaspora]|nr:MAG: hypothetical protein M1820_005237 [Bogoriella megaspora]
MGSGADIKKLAMIGCGSMGGGMAQLFAEQGIDVSLSDPSDEAINYLLEQAKTSKVDHMLHKHKDYKELCESLDSPKLFVFSLPHGDVGDKVLAGLMPYLEKGDVILDCANEHWENTERRQGKCCVKGIRYVGCGVSGGYQAARRGPSMCPGGDDDSLNFILPLLEKVAAKDAKGRPCTGKAGLGGAGHYVKMIHNGIEHGMMSAISEAWGIMAWGLGLSNDEVGSIFEKWNSEGGLLNTFLIDITGKISKMKHPNSNDYVLNEVMDKVVQDVCGEEGTGVWSNEEGVAQHVPAPTLTAAHYMRLASAEYGKRVKAKTVFGGDWPVQKIEVSDKAAFIEDLRQAVYVSCLAAFVQGINIIESADREHKWLVDYAQVLQIWRGGCIIQADGIEELLKPVLEGYKEIYAKPDGTLNLLFQPTVANALKGAFPSLKRVVLKGIEGDHCVPALGGTLDYLKYVTSTDLVTQMSEAQLDFFGNHKYDKKGDKDPYVLLPELGKYHFEWKPA